MNETPEIKRERTGLHATMQQRLAANPKDSVWVEASAGTGKTKVLSDRVLRLLLENVSPSRILCLTYTKAAAVEMSARIAKRLSDWVVANDELLEYQLLSLLGGLPDTYKELEKLKATARKLFAKVLDIPGGMKIQTIHSFCQEILKRFPLEANISPYFEVMDDRASNEALLKIRDDLIENIRRFPNSPSAISFSYLTKNISEFTFSKVVSEITLERNKISKLFDSYENIDFLLKDIANSLNVSDDDDEDRLKKDFFDNLDIEISKNLMNAWFASSEAEIKKAMKMAEILENTDKTAFYEEYLDLFLTTDGAPRKIGGIKSAILFYPDLPEVFSREQDRILFLENKLKSVRVYQSTKAVLYLAQELIFGYREYKKIHSKMDYEDLIVLTRDLLQSADVADWVLFKLDGGIDHVLLDEAQDTSPNQWGIIKSVTGDFFSGYGASKENRTMFVVGDRKQSIYSFQGADPREFEENRVYYSSIEEEFKNVRLDVSFRSAPAVLDLVNHVFSDEISRKGVVLDGEDLKHLPFRHGDSGRIELWPIKGVEKPEDSGKWEKPISRITKESSRSNLAKEIALKIRDMVSQKVILKSKDRPVSYKDFLILVRQRNEFIDDLIKECKLLNVNIAGADKISLLEQIAVQDLISLAKFLLLPKDDLSLAEVLKSPIFGLNDDDLLKLCFNRYPYSLWQQMIRSEEWKDEVSKLQELLNMVDYKRPFEIFSYVMNKIDGRRKFVSRMGQEVLDGLDEFMNLTLSFEQEHIPTLQNFVAWIMQDEVEIKREQEQSGMDMVRVMTVHGSKGLQAPIVIMPDTTTLPRVSREAGVLWAENGLFYFPLGSKDYDEVCSKIKEKEAESTLNEYRRLLYVAITRAEDILYIAGYDDGGKAADNSWYSLVEKKFAEIGKKEEDGKLVHETTQDFKIKEEKKEDIKIFKKSSSPSWMFRNALVESPLAKPYAPSLGDEEELIKIALVSPIGENGTNRYRRGNLIHKLLQFLPNVKAENRKSMIDSFLAKNAEDLAEYQKNRIKEEVLRLFENEDFSILFGEKSKEEVSIMGEVDGKIISAQLDRIVELDDRVLIVDFKTNRPASRTLEETPKIYINQLAVYKKLLEKIYPTKKIESYILWTDIAFLMNV